MPQKTYRELFLDYSGFFFIGLSVGSAIGAASTKNLLAAVLSLSPIPFCWYYNKYRVRLNKKKIELELRNQRLENMSSIIMVELLKEDIESDRTNN